MKKQMFKKFLSAFLVSALMFTTLPGGMLKAGAASTLSITQTGGTGGYTQDADGSISITANGNYIISGGSTTAGITVAHGVSANVKLESVNIDVSGITYQSAFYIKKDACVNLTLSDKNVLKSGVQAAGLQVLDGASVVINGGSSDSLNAAGGNYAAGIGGVSDAGGTITISGGVITATGGSSGAGIGGGSNGAGGTITISGGTVNANGGDYGAGIGGGNLGDGGTIDVSGGKVTTTGGMGGAGIGGGSSGNGGITNISGNAQVTANGGMSGAGIGGGIYKQEGTVTISGGTISAAGSNGSHGIGCGAYGGAGTTVITGGSVNSTVQGSVTDGNGHTEYCVTTAGIAVNTTVTGSVCGGPTSDMQTGAAGKLYFWMPATGLATVKSGGTWYSTGILSILGNMTATLAAMTALDISKGSITIGDGTVTQTGQSPAVNSNGYVVAQNGSNSTTNTVSVTGGTHNIVLSGVTIDVSNNANACAFSIANTSSVNLSLSGANTLKSGKYHAGLETPQGASLSITGGASDSLIASSYIFGAGIGGGGSPSGNGGTGGTITINGGKVDAYGSAGIGGGHGGNGGAGGTITINGGTVTAKGDNNLGAAIGGSGGSNTGGAGGIIKITGGTVNAISGNNDGIGIGGGSGNDSIGSGGAGGTVTITGGTVNTTRPDDGFGGIGGGNKGSAGTTTITGGSVKTSSIQGTPTNGSVDLYPATVSVPSGKNVNTLAVKQGYTAYNYGCKDMQMDAASYGKLYLWLPADTAPQETTADIVTDSGVYTGYHDQRGVSSSATVDNPGVLKMDQSLTIGCITDRGSYPYGSVPAATVSGGAPDIAATVSYSGTGSSTQPTDVGNYTVTATKTGNDAYYPGSKTAAFTINKKDVTNDAGLSVSIPDQTYTGSAITPQPTVKDGNAPLTLSTDYTVSSYSNNTNSSQKTDANPPTATVTFKGNYSGRKTEKFTINKKEITFSLNVGTQGQTYAAGDNIPLHVTISDAANQPAGTVTFICDGQPFASSSNIPIQTVSGNYTASVNWTATAGKHSFKAVYNPASSGENYTCAGAEIDNYTVGKKMQAALTVGSGTDYTVNQGVISKTFGDEAFTLNVTGGSGNGAVDFSSTGDAVSVDQNGKITIRAAGSSTVTATKAAQGNYLAASTSVAVNVGKATTSVTTAPSASDIAVIGKLSASNLTGGSGSVAGSFAWANPDVVATHSGSYEATFIPTDTADYSSCACMVNIVVTPILTNSQSNISFDLTGVTLPTGVTSVSLDSAAQGSGSDTYSTVVKLIGQNQALGSLSGLTVYDLKLLDQNGNPITPLFGKIKVKISIPSGMSGNLKVFWYNPADGTLTDMNAVRENGYLVFETSHFSYYAIAQFISSTGSGSSSGTAGSTVPNPKTGSGNWPLIPIAVLGGGAATGAVIIKRRRFFKIKK